MLKFLRQACPCIASSDHHGGIFPLIVIHRGFSLDKRASGILVTLSVLFQKSMNTMHPCPFQDVCVRNPVLPIDLYKFS